MMEAFDDNDLESTTLTLISFKRSTNSSSDNATTRVDVHSSLRTMAVVLYLTTFVFGIVGNTLTIAAIATNRKLRSAAACFILNLAVADELCVLSLPLLAYSTYTMSWIFGPVLCKAMTVFKCVNGYVSVFTMVLMSIDRYLAVVHPLTSRRYRTTGNATIICALIWTACTVIMTPYWLYSVERPHRRQGPQCEVIWPDDDGRHRARWFWTNFELVVGFVLPVAVMSVCYLRLIVCLIRGVHQNNETDGLSGASPGGRQIKKITGMVFAVTLAFIVCWTPYRVISYSRTVMMASTAVSGSTAATSITSAGPPTAGVSPTSVGVINVQAHIVAPIISQCLVFVSSCCNPFIYCISSRHFSKYHNQSSILLFINTGISSWRLSVAKPRSANIFRKTVFQWPDL